MIALKVELIDKTTQNRYVAIFNSWCVTYNGRRMTVDGHGMYTERVIIDTSPEGFELVLKKCLDDGNPVMDVRSIQVFE